MDTEKCLVKIFEVKNHSEYVKDIPIGENISEAYKTTAIDFIKEMESSSSQNKGSTKYIVEIWDIHGDSGSTYYFDENFNEVVQTDELLNSK